MQTADKPASAKTPWPNHADGRPMKMGEMAREQQMIQLRQVCADLQNDQQFHNALRAIVSAPITRA